MKFLLSSKAQHQLALEKERTSSRELHSELIKLRNQNEEHVGALENKISEFVASVGDFERKKCDDAELIENLKVIYLFIINFSFIPSVVLFEFIFIFF